MLKDIEVLYHSSIKISKEKIIYIDPYNIDKNYNDADIIFITHDHYDHYSEDDIDKVRKFNSIFVIPDDLLPKLLEKVINQENIFTLDSGDTDITEENKKVKCDVAFVPVGGIYTMDFKEAAQLINIIKPKVAVPIHYGSVVGTKQDATEFIKLLYPTTKGVNLMKQ